MLTLKPLSPIMNRPVFYRLWQAPFVDAKFAPIIRHNRLADVRQVLDVGCGPGTCARFFRDQSYLGVDHNPDYIATARRNHPGRFVVGDACSFVADDPDGFDFILLNSLLHHIGTVDVRRMLSRLHDQLAPNGHVHILDLVLPATPSIARFLARSDRGDYPRPWSAWLELFRSAFDEVVCEPYTVRCCGIPLWNMIYFKGRRQT